MSPKNFDYKRIIISDLHLGAESCKEDSLINFLENNSADEIILAGDVIDFIKIPTFTKKTLKIFNLIKSFKKVIYISGNHDISTKNFKGLNIDNIFFYNKYEFYYSDRHYLIKHGDDYERGIVHNRFFIRVVSVIQDFLERLFSIDLLAIYQKFLKRQKVIKRIWDNVHLESNYDVIITGHTHMPEAFIWVDKNQNIKTYVNSGDWTSNCTYITIMNGEVRLKKWDQKVLDKN